MKRTNILWDRLYSTLTELASHHNTVHWGLVYFSEVFPFLISPKWNFLAVEENSVTHRMGIWRCVRCKAVVVADGVEQTWSGCYSLRLTLSQGHVVSGWKPHLYLAILPPVGKVSTPTPDDSIPLPPCLSPLLFASGAWLHAMILNGRVAKMQIDHSAELVVPVGGCQQRMERWWKPPQPREAAKLNPAEQSQKEQSSRKTPWGDATGLVC